MSSARTSPLARLIAGPEALPQLQMRTGVVRAVDKATTPHTVTLDIAGLSLTGVTYLAGWDPEAGATVKVLVQGPDILVLGPLAPARMVVAAHDHATPPTNPAPPPAPDAAPTAPVSRRTVSVVADASDSWQPEFSRWRVDGVYQGGGSGQRGYWYYGSKIATAKGSGTIVAATVFVKRASSGGVNGLANIRLGTHTAASRPGSSVAHSNVAKVGALAKGKGGTFALTAAQVAALNAGAAGVGLEPGALGYTSADYFIGQPRSSGDWSGVLSLTIEG